MCIDSPESSTKCLSIRFYYGWRWETPFVSRWENCGFVSFLWVLRYSWPINLHASPRAHRSLSFNLLLRPILKFQSVGSAMMRNFDLNFSQRRTFVFSDACVTLRSFCEPYSSDWFPRLVCSSVKVDKDSGGSVSWNTQPNGRTFFKIYPLHLCHHPFSVILLGWPSCVQTSTYHRICIPILTYRTDIRENVKNHMVIWYKYLLGKLCTAVERISQMDSGHWGSFSSTHFYLFVSVVQSALHADIHRAGNYTCLLSNTVLSLSIDSILLVFFQHHVHPCNS